MNRVVINGRLTRDVEIRKTQSGLSVASFTIAQNDEREKDKTYFFNCVVWRQGAEFLGQYARKGDLIGVDGKLTTRTYTRDGQNITVTEVVADKVEIEAKKAQSQQNEYSSAPQQNYAQTAQNQPSQAQYTPQYNNYQPQPSPEVEMAAKYGLDISSDDLPF